MKLYMIEQKKSKIFADVCQIATQNEIQCGQLT